ncbi:hypothetical protein PPYR_11461 [Photinus pyralis]|uniref:RNA-directed DNA polymerase n=1 Tax=Photinus pyralis TaxID=7054 RepID=A0A5N4ABD0_PHOPY|nr:hypothetical protein PPYR_11461 [Photinus pyralis]
MLGVINIEVLVITTAIRIINLEAIVFEEEILVIGAEIITIGKIILAVNKYSTIGREYIQLRTKIRKRNLILHSSFFVPIKTTKEKIELILNANGLNFVRMGHEGEEYKFLIDTGATISIIFDKFVDKSKINTSNCVTIKGITGLVKALGTANIALQIADVCIQHEFTVMNQVDADIHGMIDKNNVILHDRTDHPGVVELLKKPIKATELRPISQEEFSKILKNKKYDVHIGEYIYDKELQLIYYCIQDSRSTSSLSESLRDLEYICKQNNIPELIVIKKNQNAFYPNRFCINKNFLNEIIKIGKQLKTRNLKISILKDIEHITDKDTQQLIINDFHMLPTGGHAGINRTYNNIKRYYFWNGLQKDVQNFIRKCDDYQRYKHSNAKIEPMEITTTATSAYQKVYLDLIGPLEPDEKNHKYILTLQCELSKFVEAYPLINKEANTVAEAFVQNFILRYGVPDEIVTDKGTEFLNSTLTEVCKILKIKKTKFNSIPPPNFRLFGKFS